MLCTYSALLWLSSAVARSSLKAIKQPFLSDKRCCSCLMLASVVNASAGC